MVEEDNEDFLILLFIFLLVVDKDDRKFFIILFWFCILKGRWMIIEVFIDWSDV